MLSRVLASAGPVLALAVSVMAVSRGLPLGLDLYRPVPDDNPLTPERIALGRQLFRERRLSRDGSMSCATCHQPNRAFSDGRVVARGVGGATGDRNVPAIVNRAWGESFFWDGRTRTLEAQVLEPLLNPRELAMTASRVVAVADAQPYRTRFVRAYGRAPALADVARALASYVRTIVSGNSAFDRYAAGDRAALTSDALRGLALFRGQAGCWTCHVGPLLTDERFHNTGVAWRQRDARSRGTLADPGRGAVTSVASDQGAFKTPSLREIGRSAPYMHDGSLATLADVVDFYNAGGRPNPSLDPRLKPLRLTAADKRYLLAFLHALDGRIQEGE